MAGARGAGGGRGQEAVRLVYKGGDSLSKSKTRTKNLGNGGRCHHCPSPNRIKLKVISRPAIARNILLPVGLPSCLFFCPSYIPPSFSPLSANFALSTISSNVSTRNAISNSRVNPTICPGSLTNNGLIPNGAPFSWWNGLSSPPPSRYVNTLPAKLSLFPGALVTKALQPRRLCFATISSSFRLIPLIRYRTSTPTSAAAVSLGLPGLRYFFFSRASWLSSTANKPSTPCPFSMTAMAARPSCSSRQTFRPFPDDVNRPSSPSACRKPFSSFSFRPFKCDPDCTTCTRSVQ